MSELRTSETQCSTCGLELGHPNAPCPNCLPNFPGTKRMVTSNPCDDGLRSVQCPGCLGKGCNWCNEGQQLRPAPETFNDTASTEWRRANQRTKNHVEGCDCADCRIVRGASETCDAADAAKWRALRDCARITAMGCAGLTQPHNVDDAYAHLTLNFWTGIDDGDPGPAYAREWLDKFVAKALRAGLKASEPQHGGRPMTLRECMDAEDGGST